MSDLDCCRGRRPSRDEDNQNIEATEALDFSKCASHPLHPQSFPMSWSDAGKATSGGCCEESPSNGQKTCPELGSEVLGRSKNREEAQIAWGNMRKIEEGVVSFVLAMCDDVDVSCYCFVETAAGLQGGRMVIRRHPWSWSWSRYKISSTLC